MRAVERWLRRRREAPAERPRPLHGRGVGGDPIDLVELEGREAGERSEPPDESLSGGTGDLEDALRERLLVEPSPEVASWHLTLMREVARPRRSRRGYALRGRSLPRRPAVVAAAVVLVLGSGLASARWLDGFPSSGGDRDVEVRVPAGSGDAPGEPSEGAGGGQGAGAGEPDDAEPAADAAACDPRDDTAAGERAGDAERCDTAAGDGGSGAPEEATPPDAEATGDGGGGDDGDSDGDAGDDGRAEGSGGDDRGDEDEGDGEAGGGGESLPGERRDGRAPDHAGPPDGSPPAGAPPGR